MAEKKKTTTKKKPAKKAVKKVSKKAEPVKKKAPTVKKTAVKKKSPPKRTLASAYFEGVGRRKTAVARVRLFPKLKSEFVVNGKKHSEYFPIFEMEQTASSPLVLMNLEDKFKIIAKVKGSGSHSQAEAVRHGLSRALVKFNPEFRKRLKKAGFLTRDPRMRERKKFGKKRARKAPQWSKR